MKGLYGPGTQKNPYQLDLLSSVYKTFKVQVYQDLLPSYWNNVTIVLSPANEKDIENIDISIETSTVVLKVNEPNLTQPE